MAGVGLSWSKRSKLPFKYHSNVFIINGTMAVIPVLDGFKTFTPDGIYVLSNLQWIKTANTSLFKQAKHISVTQSENTTYILFEQGIVTYTDNKFGILSSDDYSEESQIIHFNDTLHLIFDKYDTHCILGPNTNEYNEYQFVFHQNKYVKGAQRLYGNTLVKYGASILSVGGYCFDDNAEYEYFDTVYEYTRLNETPQWSQWYTKLPMKMSDSPCIIVDNKILFFGGETEDDISRNIFIYDNNLKYFGISDVTLPSFHIPKVCYDKSEHFNDCLAKGFTRTLCTIPPHYLIELIRGYICAGIVHLLSNGIHYTIGIETILRGYEEPISIFFDTNANATTKKRALISLKWKRRYLKTNRYKYIGEMNEHTYQLQTLDIGYLKCCMVCDKISQLYNTQYQHLLLTHCTQNPKKTTDAISGGNYMYCKLSNVDDGKTYQCLFCPKRFGSSTACMSHGKAVHVCEFQKLQ